MVAGMTSQRDEFFYNAKLAEQTERYDDMVDNMKKAVMVNPVLALEERNMLSVSYKNAMGSRRSSCRVLASLERKEAAHENGGRLALVQAYRAKLEEELCKICLDALNLLDEQLLPNAADADSKVFYEKMKGDYYRYMAEVSRGGEKECAKAAGKAAYESATATARAQLRAMNPIRLGLALNYSVFQCEIMDDTAEACKMGQLAFDEAMNEIDSVSDDTYKDSTLIMQLIRDNLTVWADHQQSEDPGAPADNAGNGEEGGTDGAVVEEGKADSAAKVKGEDSGEVGDVPR